MIDLSVFCFENEVTLSAFLQNLYTTLDIFPDGFMLFLLGIFDLFSLFFFFTCG